MSIGKEFDGGVRNSTNFEGETDARNAIKSKDYSNKLEDDNEKKKIEELKLQISEKKYIYNQSLKSFENKLRVNYETTKQNLQKYDVQAIEFSWLFISDDRKRFLDSLARSPDLEIFSLKIVENIIQLMWTYYRIVIFAFSLIPFLIYFVTFLIYATWIQREKSKESDKTGRYHQGNYALCALILLMVILNTVLEGKKIVYVINQMFKSEFTLRPVYKFFSSMWNIINISSLILNAFVVIADLSGLKERNLVPCLAIATLLMWFRLFYFGRMSSRTAGMVRMIYSVFTKIGNFLIILLIMVLGFANIFFIMSRIENNGFIGDSYWDALTYSYL